MTNKSIEQIEKEMRLLADELAKIKAKKQPGLYPGQAVLVSDDLLPHVRGTYQKMSGDKFACTHGPAEVGARYWKQAIPDPDAINQWEPWDCDQCPKGKGLILYDDGSIRYGHFNRYMDARAIEFMRVTKPVREG